MKINIDIDCTAAEARELLGLPEVKPMQDAWLASMEKRMLADMERYSPQSLVESWLASGSVSTDWLQNAFGMRARSADERGKSKKE